MSRSGSRMSAPRPPPDSHGTVGTARAPPQREGERMHTRQLHAPSRKLRVLPLTSTEQLFVAHLLEEGHRAGEQEGVLQSERHLVWVLDETGTGFLEVEGWSPEDDERGSRATAHTEQGTTHDGDPGTGQRRERRAPHRSPVGARLREPTGPGPRRRPHSGGAGRSCQRGPTARPPHTTAGPLRKTSPTDTRRSGAQDTLVWNYTKSPGSRVGRRLYLELQLSPKRALHGPF